MLLMRGIVTRDTKTKINSFCEEYFIRGWTTSFVSPVPCSSTTPGKGISLSRTTGSGGVPGVETRSTDRCHQSLTHRDSRSGREHRDETLRSRDEVQRQNGRRGTIQGDWPTVIQVVDDDTRTCPCGHRSKGSDVVPGRLVGTWGESVYSPTSKTSRLINGLQCPGPESPQT